MNKTKNLSVIINCGNEEKYIKDCLESVLWADEIIVFLSQKITDKTEDIVKKYPVCIYSQEPAEMDFAAWHNQGISKASGKWLLWIDADERISQSLRQEIEEIIRQDSPSAYAISRKNNLLGKDLKFGGWYPDYAKRLFRKDILIKWTGRVHEEPVIKSGLKLLKYPLIHLQPDTLEPALEKTIRWTDIEADLLLKSNHPYASWWRIIRMGLTTLWIRLIVGQGWRDGTEGVIESVFQTYHTMFTYFKVWEKQII